MPLHKLVIIRRKWERRREEEKRERGRKGKKSIKIKERETEGKEKQREIRRINGWILELSTLSKKKPCASGIDINTMAL